MKDKTYSLPLLPLSMAALTVDGANAIEENLRYLISLFSLFDAQIKAGAIGTLGYLELNETGTAGDGFLVENAVQIDMLTIFVDGRDLSNLVCTGADWVIESRTASSIRLSCEADEYWDADGVQQALSALQFSATAELDATITLVASCKTVMAFDALGPVDLRFRAGATWALIEDQAWTWEGIEAAELNWEGLQSLHK